MNPEAEEEEIPNIDFGLTIPTQIFLDKITTKYNCEKSDIRVFIFSIASAALIIQIITPIIKVFIERIGGGTSPSGVGQIVDLILGYVSSFLGALCTFVINDQHVLLNADLVWPYKKFDYYLSLTVGEEETSGETLSEETSGETLYEETSSGETVIKPVRIDSGIRLWGNNENNRIGIVRINPKLVEDYTEYLGNYVDLASTLGDLKLCIVPFAGKLTIRSVSTDGPVVENFSAFIDLDDKYYGKYNMQVNRIRINETKEGFQVAFMRNNSTLFSIDSEMR